MSNANRSTMTLPVLVLFFGLVYPTVGAQISLLNGRTFEGEILSRSDKTITIELESGERQSISTKYVYEIDGVPYSPQTLESALPEDEPNSAMEQTVIPSQPATDIPAETSGCTKDVDCPGSRICASGKCVDSSPKVEAATDKQCSKDTDCPGDLICVDNRCDEPAGNAASKVSCTKDTDCPGDLICKGKECVPPAKTENVPVGGPRVNRKDAVTVHNKRYMMGGEEIRTGKLEALLEEVPESRPLAQKARTRRITGTVLNAFGMAILIPITIANAASSSSSLAAARARLGVTIGISTVSLTTVIVGSVLNRSARERLRQAIDQYNGSFGSIHLRDCYGQAAVMHLNSSILSQEIALDQETNSCSFPSHEARESM